MAALTWLQPRRALIACSGGTQSELAQAIGDRWEGWKATMPPLLYAAGIVLAFFAPIVCCALYAAAAAMWLVPDRRIEN